MPDDVTQSDGAVTELGQAGEMLLAELEAAHEAKAAAEARIELVRRGIEMLMGDATEAHVAGRPVITWRPVTSRRFDTQTAKRFLSPEQIDACMVASESRPFKRVAQ